MGVQFESDRLRGNRLGSPAVRGILYYENNSSGTKPLLELGEDSAKSASIALRALDTAAESDT